MKPYVFIPLEGWAVAIAWAALFWGGLYYLINILTL
jgi:hypothetical protein